VFFFFPRSYRFTLPTFIALNVIFIIQASLVMVIEMRVRANEVRHGLDMLESKVTHGVTRALLITPPPLTLFSFFHAPCSARS
jgi:hypothetical protein